MKWKLSIHNMIFQILKIKSNLDDAADLRTEK